MSCEREEGTAGGRTDEDGGRGCLVCTGGLSRAGVWRVVAEEIAGECGGLGEGGVVHPS